MDNVIENSAYGEVSYVHNTKTAYLRRSPLQLCVQSPDYVMRSDPLVQYVNVYTNIRVHRCTSKFVHKV